MTFLGWIASAIGVIAVAAAGLVALGNGWWQRSTREQMAKLEAARLAPASRRYDARELEGLPPPVARYLGAVQKDGQPLVAAVTFEMTGSFNMSTTGERWKPFTSSQRVVVHRPGFLWNGSVSMFPGIHARVHDRYIAGVGALHATLLGLFTVARVEGQGEIAQGELMRYFAEMPWYPTALLPSQGVHWEAVDDHSAWGTLSDGPISLTLLFRFDEAGLIASVHADARGAVSGAETVMRPWDCRVSNYQLRSGMLVPTRGEAAWMHLRGRRPYFIGTLSSLVYEFAP